MSSLIAAVPTFGQNRGSGARQSQRTGFPLSQERAENAPTSIHLLDEDADRAAARQAHLPRGLVCNAELERFRLAALDYVERLGHHRPLDAATRYGSEKITLIIDHQVRADRPRRGTPGLDHGRERDPASGPLPVLGRFQNVFIARE